MAALPLVEPVYTFATEVVTTRSRVTVERIVWETPLNPGNAKLPIVQLMVVGLFGVRGISVQHLVEVDSKSDSELVQNRNLRTAEADVQA